MARPVFPIRRSAVPRPVVNVSYDAPNETDRETGSTFPPSSPSHPPSPTSPERSPNLPGRRTLLPPTMGVSSSASSPLAPLLVPRDPFANDRPRSSIASPAIPSSSGPSAPSRLATQGFTLAPATLSLSMVLNGVGEAVSDAWPTPVWVEAEVAKWRAHGNGHIYLELVERNEQGQERAKANARIWATHAAGLVRRFESSTGERLRDGIRSQWRVKPDFSARFGFGLTIDDVRPVWSEGQHDRQKQAIRDRLKQDGVWEAQRAHAFPSVIARIAVVAPFDAAGWGDFSSEAQRWEKAGLVTTVMRTATFEGDKTSQSVSEAIAAFTTEQDASLTQHGRPAYDVLIVLRGGGAKTSLAWMDDERIVRAILAFPGPVWSAIGHEQDRGLPDEVAAWSAHTPSKAAQKIWETLVHETSQAQGWMDELAQELRHRPESLAQNVDHRWASLQHEAEQRWSHAQQAVDHAWGLLAQEAHQRPVQSAQSVERAWDTLRQTAHERVERLAQRTDDLVREVVGLGPAATLARGYAVVLGPNGHVLNDANSSSPGPWTVRWASGDRSVTPHAPPDPVPPS